MSDDVVTNAFLSNMKFVPPDSMKFVFGTFIIEVKNGVFCAGKKDSARYDCSFDVLYEGRVINVVHLGLPFNLNDTIDTLEQFETAVFSRIVNIICSGYVVAPLYAFEGEEQFKRLIEDFISANRQYNGLHIGIVHTIRKAVKDRTAFSEDFIQFLKQTLTSGVGVIYEDQDGIVFQESRDCRIVCFKKKDNIYQKFNSNKGLKSRLKLRDMLTIE